jgi:hypothetical protein
MLIKLKGKLNFYPENVSKKHLLQSEWKKVAVISLDCDVEEYYAWFLAKRFGIKFNKNLRGAHITIISDKVNFDKYDEIAKIYQDTYIDFYHELEPRTNTKHWWLRVHSPQAEDIRELMGLSRTPYFGFHLTIGYINEFNLEHSKYIFETVKLFDLISSENRKDISEHEIIDFAKDI